MRRIISGLVAILAVQTGAQAADRNATAAIVAGDLPQAERILTTERRIFPNRPELMLNLAAVYRQTGREAEANALYASVLRRPAALMDLPDQQIVSSHVLAQAGLQKSTQIASR
ncbi:tetratricopeptide repeat protein [Sphingomonas sp.]|jgi:thioredoxin-like negative regulator of GroEL|uniref:tetratricopeptide repeat protein n=1 Tax=Sphingomonas sp. TaxID=28214 RepID=UPI002ED78026